MTKQQQKNSLGLAGEYRVLSELLLKGFNSTLTMGNAKGTDILVFGNDNKFIRVEVKTSKNGRNFVTSYFPKYSTESSTDPHVWVLFLPKELNNISEDLFYVLSHSQVRELQLIMNKGNETKKGQGVDNITLKLLKEKEVEQNMWQVVKKELDKV